MKPCNSGGGTLDILAVWRIQFEILLAEILNSNRNRLPKNRIMKGTSVVLHLINIVIYFDYIR